MSTSSKTASHNVVPGLNGVSDVSDGVLGMPGVSDVDQEAYQVNYATHRVGITLAESIKQYNRDAHNYEKYLCRERYLGPEIAADCVRSHGRPTDRVLDVGAGTGFLGQELVKRGFANLDALEPAEKLRDLAAEKGIYSNLYSDLMDGTRINPIADDTYDVMVLSGAMGEGHIPCAGLLEMIRIVKNGGIVVIVMRQEYLGYVTEYRDRLEILMAELEQQQQWVAVERTVVTNYSFGKNGVQFVYRVRVNGVTADPNKLLAGKLNL